MKKLLRKLLFPNRYVILIGALVSAALLPLTLTGIISIKPIEYFAYALSAYSLTVLVIAIVYRKPVKRAKELLRKNKYLSRYLDEIEVRGRIALYLGLLFNTAYGLIKIVSGLIYRSEWFITLGFYYLIMGGIKLWLSRDTLKLKDGKRSREWLSHALKSYRRCGVLMFLLNIAVTSVAGFMIRGGKYAVYPGFLIYANAAFAFYCIITSIINIVKFRRANNPVLSASKAVNLAGALVSIFALQTAMIPQFSEGDTEFRSTMNTITGGVVCASVFAIALFMVIRSNIQLKKLKEDNL